MKRVERPSPNHDARGAPIDMLVLHYTGMTSAQAALDRLIDPAAQVSAHYLIDEDGSVVRLVDETKRAWHAGVSMWRGQAGVNARSIGIELVNTLWRKLTATPAAAAWAELQPAGEDVRLHLLHLLAAHHGELQFGSPVVPKTPEAWALHYVDNLDAKLEMLAAGYANSKPLAPRIQERVWPLPGNLVAPLVKFLPPRSE
jgi:hypothetical protein